MDRYFTEAILQSLLPEVQQSVTDLFSEKEKLESDLAATTSKLEDNELQFEQRYYELEKEMLKAKEDLKLETKKCEDLATQIKTHNDEGLITKKEVLQLRQDHKEANASVETLQSKLNCLVNEKLDLNQVLESRTQEIEYLSEETKKLRSSLKRAENARIEAEANYEKFVSTQENHGFEVSQLKHQLDLLNMQIEKQSDDIMSKHEEIQRLRREKIFAASDVQKQLDKLTEEHAVLKSKLDDSTKLSKQYEGQVSRYIDKLKDADEFNAGLESHYQKEMENQTKLAELYGKANEEAEAKNKNLLDAVAELQKMVLEANQAREKTEESHKKVTSDLESLKEEYEKEVEQLKVELERANELIEVSKKSKELIEMSPSAEAISKQMKAGMTFTDLYSKYVDATQQLDYEKAENLRLKKAIEQIVDEIEEKAPVLRQQKEDYENSLVSISELTQKLDLALVQSQKAKFTIESLQRANDYMKRQNAALEQSKQDFCKQLQHLLQEIAILKGANFVDDRNNVPDPSAIDDETFANDSDKVISMNLVKYSDIIDLQVKNTQLLAALRSISDEKEAEQQDKYRTKLENLEMKLKAALDDNERYRDELTTMKEIMTRTEKQKEMYKILFEQEESLDGNRAGNKSLTPTATDVSTAKETFSQDDAASGSFETSKSPSKSSNVGFSGQACAVSAGMGDEEQKMLQDVIQQLKEELKEWKEEAKNAEIKANERCCEYSKENSELRLQNSKTLSEAQNLNEKVKLQELNESVLQKELEQYRKQVNAMSATQAKMQSNIDILNTEVRSAQEKYSSAYARLQSLQSEKELLKNTEKHLVRERDRLLEDKKVQSTLMANIDSLKNSLELNANEQKLRYQRTISTLQTNLDVAQKKMREMETERRASVKTYEDKLKELNEKLSIEANRNLALNTDLTHLKNDNATLQSQLQQKSSNGSAFKWASSGGLPSPVSPAMKSPGQKDISGDSTDVEDLRDVLLKLERANNEISILANQKAALEKHIDNYKEMCKVSEQKYNGDTVQLNEKIQSLEKQLKDQNNAQKNQFQTIAKLENDNNRLRDDLKTMIDNSDSSHSKIVKKCDDLENQLSKSLGTNKALKSEIDNLKSQLSDKTQNLALLSEKLETSSQKLSDGSSQVAAAESQLMEKNREVEKMYIQVNSLNQEIENLKSLIQNNLESYKTKEEDWRKQLDDVDNQNKILLEEIDKLGGLLNKTKESCLNQNLNDSMIQGSIDENPPPGTENLIEVIRHLRREKDICLAKYEVNQGECERARQKLEFTHKRVTELESMLKEEEERHQKTYQALSQQEELQKKMDQILVLQESNAYLRKENAQFLGDLKAEKHRQKRAEEAALKPLQDEIATLKLNSEAHVSEVQIMTDEIAKWKARNNELLERITKIDSEENKKVLMRAKELEARNVALSAELKTTESKMFNINKEKNDFAEKYRASSTESNLLRTAKNALETEKNTLSKQSESLKNKIEEIEKENKMLKVSADKVSSIQTRYKNLQVYAKSQLENVKKLQEENETLKTQMAARTKEVAELSPAKTAMEQKMKQESGEGTSAGPSSDNKDVLLQSENLELRSRCETLESEVKKLKLSLDETQKRSSLLETTLSNRGLDLASSGNDLKNRTAQIQIENLQKKNKALEEDNKNMELMKKKYLDIINVLKKRYKDDLARLEKDKNDLTGEVTQKQEESKKNLEERDKFRELCLQYENKIESLESKIEALEMAAKTKPREVRLGNDDQPSTSQPKLAVSGQQRTDSSSKGSVDRPSANIKPQPQRTPQATIRPTPQPVAPQTTVVHVQPMQSVQSSGNDAPSTDQIPQPSTSVPTGSVFGIANPQNSARVAPQVRTVGEISSVQTPPHAQEFAIHTSAASSTTIDIITTSADNSGIVQSTDGVTASTASALVMPLTSRTPINLPISNSERGGDTTAAIQPYNLHPSYGTNLGNAPYLNITAPLSQVSPDQQQQEISSSSAQQAQLGAPLIGPYSTSGRPIASSTSYAANRGESGPADSSFASSVAGKRNRDSLTSSDEEHSGGKRARVLPTSSADDNLSRAMTSGSSQHRSVNDESNEVDPVIIPSGVYSEPVQSSSTNTIGAMVLPEIPIAVYDAIAAISSSAADLSSVSSAEMPSQHPRSSVAQNDNEADAFQVDFRGSGNEDYEGGTQTIQTIGVAADSNTSSSIEPSVIESGQYEEIEETIGTTEETNDDDECEVGEISARGEDYEGEEVGYMDDTNDQDEEGESDEDDDDDDGVICLNEGENDAEPQFASLEPHDALMQNEDNQQEINELDQDEFNAYVEEPLQPNTMGGHVEVIGSDFPAEHSSEGGFIVSTEQPFAVAQSETYNIEAMESSSGQPTAGMHANNDNLVWTKSPDRVQNVANLEVDTSEPQSPASDNLALRSVSGESNDAAVTSSGTVVEHETIETPQLRSIENVARKSTRPSRPRLRRNPASNVHGSGGNGTDESPMGNS